MTAKEKSSNIELLKIFAMVGIVVLHYNNGGIGGGFTHVRMYTANSYLLYFLECAFIPAVDIFMIITGYFMFPRKSVDLNKPVRLLLQVSLFREILYISTSLLDGRSISLFPALQNLLPASYFSVLYVCVYILSPYVNKTLASLSPENLRRFVAILFVILSAWPYTVDVLETMSGVSFYGLSSIGLYGSQSGYTLINFLFMYIIGAWIRHSGQCVKTRYCIPILLFLWFFMFAAAYHLQLTGYGFDLMFAYCSPLVILSAVLSFHIFNNIKIKSSPAINSFASATFSVYLLNDVIISRYFNTQPYVTGGTLRMLFHLGITCVCVCLIGWLVQSTYEYITQPFLRLFRLSFTISAE